jgi:hypothetical protein
LGVQPDVGVYDDVVEHGLFRRSVLRLLTSQ